MNWGKIMLSVDEFINYSDKYYAHIIQETSEEISRTETLTEHTKLCQKYFIMLAEDKKFDKIIKIFENEYLLNFSEKALELFEYMSVNIPTLHDMGKINPRFQKDKMRNKLYFKIEVDEYGNIKSNHSIISSIFYLDYFIEKIASEEDKENISKEEMLVLKDFAYIYSFIISRHHGNVIDFQNYMISFKPDYSDNIGYRAYEWYKLWKQGIRSENVDKNIEKNKLYNENFKMNDVVKLTKQYSSSDKSKMYKRISKDENKKSVYLYGWTRFLYSLLVASDYYATSEFMNGVKITEFGEIESIDCIYKEYTNGKVQKSIENYKYNIYPMSSEQLKKTKNINNLRTEMYLDAENELSDNIDKNIFYLEAPTGSGKSNTSMNLSFNLVKQCADINKIFYIYPYNTLVEQNIACIEKLFENNNRIMSQVAVVNSITPYKNKSDNFNEEKLIDKDYQRILLDRQFFNYPIVLSTHVTLFNMLFSDRKEDLFGFHQICNSVIVLDEIQTYKNSLWGEIITFLSAYADLFNIKIIIMSATLPNLDNLINNNEASVRLIKNREKYFANPIFKNRVIPDYSLLKQGNKKITLEELKVHVLKNQHKRVIVEFIKKKTAQEFYRLIKNDTDEGVTVRLMTGNSNIQERKDIINEIKELESVILVSTQVIEAGVDIDMDIGYKDISRLDSEEQFMGRINRSCKKENCIVYFFNYDDAGKIYINDARLNTGRTLEDDNIRLMLESKEFDSFYKSVFEDLSYVYGKYGENNLNDFFKKNAGHLDMKKVSEHMKLIDDNCVKMYLYLNIEKPGLDYTAAELWEEYRSLLEDTHLANNRYSEKKVKLQDVRSKMNTFMYQVRPNLQWVKCGDYEQIGDIYYIDNGQDYLDEYGMIDLDLIEDNEELFL